MIAMNMHFESLLCGSGSPTVSAPKYSIWSCEMRVPLVYFNRIPSSELFSTNLTQILWC